VANDTQIDDRTALDRKMAALERLAGGVGPFCSSHRMPATRCPMVEW
jgi:hypothetical protein